GREPEADRARVRRRPRAGASGDGSCRQAGQSEGVTGVRWGGWSLGVGSPRLRQPWLPPARDNVTSPGNGGVPDFPPACRGPIITSYNVFVVKGSSCHWTGLRLSTWPDVTSASC